MTATEIQEQFTDAPCVANLLAGQVEMVQTVLLWKLLNGDVPMTAADIQDLITSSPCLSKLTAGQLQVLQTELLWLILQKP